MEDIIERNYDEHVNVYYRYSFIAWLDSAKGEKIRALKNQRTRLPEYTVEVPEVSIPENPNKFKLLINQENFKDISPDKTVVSAQPLKFSPVLNKEIFDGIHSVDEPALSDIGDFFHKIDEKKFEDVKLAPNFETLDKKINYMPEIECGKFSDIVSGKITIPEETKIPQTRTDKEKFKNIFTDISAPDALEIPVLDTGKNQFENFLINPVQLPAAAKKFVPEINNKNFDGISPEKVKLPEFKNISYSIDKEKLKVLPAPKIEISNPLDNDKIKQIIDINPENSPVIKKIDLPEIKKSEFTMKLVPFEKIKRPEISADVNKIKDIKPEIDKHKFEKIAVIPDVPENNADISGFSVSVDSSLFSDVKPCAEQIYNLSPEFRPVVDENKFLGILPKINTKINPAEKFETNINHSLFENIASVSEPKTDFSDIFEILNREVKKG